MLHKLILSGVVFSQLCFTIHAFQQLNSPFLMKKNVCGAVKDRCRLKMIVDFDLSSLHQNFHDSANFLAIVKQGLADASSTIATSPSTAAETATVCPNFGEPGWGPFCFLNGNPVFKAFDQYQEFVQNSVVGLHDIIARAGVQQAWGLSIMLFTIFVRLVLFPLNYQQIASTQKTQALNPKVQEIREKFSDNKEAQNQMIALLYQESKVNPLAGCLPAIFQIPVFLALYRSFLNLSSQSKLSEPFLWLPDLQGPVYGTRSTDWLFGAWHDFTPKLGWHDTLAYLTIPILLYAAQSISLSILTPPSDDPQVQRSQQILKYLPLMLAYFSLSVPSGLGVYWITNNLLSTASTAGIKEYFKRNPVKFDSLDLDKILSTQYSTATAAGVNAAWGYSSEEEMVKEAVLHAYPSRAPIIPDSFQ